MGECRKSDHSKVRPTESSWILLAAGLSPSSNKQLFQCRLAVELLLLPKLPPQYHTFHNTCAAAAASEELSAFQPLCPRFGHPQTECSTFSHSSPLEESLFFSIRELSVVAQVSPTGIMIRVGAVIAWELNSGSLLPPRDGNCSSHWTAACVEESKVPKAGQRGKGLTQFMLWRRRKEESTPAIYFSPSSTIYTSLWETSLSTVEFLRLKSDFTHRPGRALLVPQHHPRFVCFLKWLILSPFPKRGSAWTQLSVRMFCLAKMWGRKEKGVSCFLPFTFKVSQPDYHSSSSEAKTEFIAFVSQLAQFSCFFQCHWTPLMNTNTLSSQKGRGELVKYIIYKK